MAKQNLTQIRCVNPKQKVRLEYTLHKESRNIRVENTLSTVFRSLFFKNSWVFNVLRIGERVALIGAFCASGDGGLPAWSNVEVSKTVVRVAYQGF